MDETGYTWSEKTLEWRAKFIERAKQPKSLETREKMRLAKLNKPKTAEHRANMSASHKFRQAVKKRLLSEDPSLTTEELWQRVREELHD